MKFNLAAHHKFASMVIEEKKIVKKMEENLDLQIRKNHILNLKKIVEKLREYWSDEESAITSYYKGQFTKMMNYIDRENKSLQIDICPKAFNKTSEEILTEHKVYEKKIKSSNFDRKADFPETFVQTAFMLILTLRVLKDRELNKLFRPYLRLCDSIMLGNGLLLEGIC